MNKQDAKEQIMLGLKKAFNPIESFKDEGSGLEVEGYVTVFNHVDRDGDSFLPPVFDEFIDRFRKEVQTNPKMLPLLYRHRWDMRVGYVKELRNDGKGVWVKAVIEEDTDTGKYVANLVRAKELSGFSHYFYNGLGFRRDGILYVQKADLMEVTLTPRPVNELALVKKFSKSKELYKAFKGMLINSLRGDGLSEREARVMFSQGIKGLGIEDEKMNMKVMLMKEMTSRLGARKS